MKTLIAEHIYIRAMEPSDIEVLYKTENNTSVWKVSNTTAPYSKFVLEQFIQTAHLDIYTNKQLRLMICLNSTNEVIGSIDLFDFEPLHLRVGIGILLLETHRKLGYATQALNLIIDYCFNTLCVHQIYCNISSSNSNSIELFEKLNFTCVGLKKQWNQIGPAQFEDEYLYQLLSS